MTAFFTISNDWMDKITDFPPLLAVYPHTELEDKSEGF